MSNEDKNKKAEALSEDKLSKVSGGIGRGREYYLDPNDPMITCMVYNMGSCKYNHDNYHECVTVKVLPGCYCNWKG